MQSEPPFCFAAAKELILDGPLLASVQQATAQAVATEFVCFLAAIGFNGGKRVSKIMELVPDIESVVLRNDETAMILTYDGQGVRLHVSADDEKLRVVEMRAADDGHSVFGIIPSHVRAWIEGTGRYARLH